MFTVTSCDGLQAPDDRRYNELPLAKKDAINRLNAGHTAVTIWQRICVVEVETKVVFKETNGRPMEPEIITTKPK